MSGLNAIKALTPKNANHPKCKGYRDDYTLEYDCEYQTTLNCDDCKYGVGRKDPEAKCNQGPTL